MTRGERNIAWIERFCRVPSGRLVGQPVVLREWQRTDIRRIYDNPAGTRTAILSFGRKNGKTSLSAFLLLLHLCGPESRQNGELYSAAQSREQAAILFSLAAKVVRQSPDLNGYVTIRDTAKQLYCADIGTLYKALSAEASTAYGLSPCFIVHDELGQVRGPRFELFEALETACGAQENPLSIVISTQAPNPTDLLSLLIDDAGTGADPRTVLSLYSAPEDADPFDLETIRLANPALGDFLNETEVLSQAEAARRMPSREPDFRNLILNQQVEMISPFISRSIWMENASAPAELRGPVYGGLDLSSVNDLTAKVYVSWQDNKFHVQPTFWLPEEGLAARSQHDRVPYDAWAKSGDLTTTPGKAIDWDFVAATIYEDFQRLDIRRINFDRWKWEHFKPCLLRAGFRQDQLEGDKAIFHSFGQGYASMAPALDTLERDLLESRIAHGSHPLLNMCAFNAIVTPDPAGNRKLDKSKATGRIDGMVALTMARAAAGTDFEKPKPSYQMMFV